MNKSHFDLLRQELKGKLFEDETTRRLYATDASSYRELPLAVAVPESKEDITCLIRFSRENNISIIPRAAGTSLAGQVVGSGIVVDISKHFNKVIEINTAEKYVRVQPGIVRDELNQILIPKGYFFAPETSSANRAMIGGMIGNNSCGANSLVYGSTREHLLEAQAILSDGSEVTFGNVENDQFFEYAKGINTKGKIHHAVYQQIQNVLSDENNLKSIQQHYPKHSVARRNTGYALDKLANTKPFKKDGVPFNFCYLLAGSEGTLAFITEAKLKLTPLPAPHKRLVCAHCDSIEASLKVNLIALNYFPTACELMDHYILEATKRNLQYAQYRFFVKGEPKAILVVEFTEEDEQELEKKTKNFINELQKSHLSYHSPVIKNEDVSKVWSLRKAGLGLLSNVPGDNKPVPVIEDTAVDVNDLPNYIREFNQILQRYGLYSVHYAHAGSGELHLRPILNLKTKEGRDLYRTIAEEISDLVKKYKGSLSGEHGDGRLRGEFIPKMLGEKNYVLCKKVKKAWDPDNLFNPQKIVNTPPMDRFLRFDKKDKQVTLDTLFDFSDTKGFVRAAEQCNGSGDCRKSQLSGGVMCPSYMATKDEKDTTRARANILREMFTKANIDPLDSHEIKEVMDLCLSCKGCKSECPSNVDITKLKAEWYYQHYKKHSIPLSTYLIANFSRFMEIAAKAPNFSNVFLKSQFLSFLPKKIMGIATQRSLPALSRITLRKWYLKNQQLFQNKFNRNVCFFVDEFTNHSDVEAGKKALLLLSRLGYRIKIIDHKESGRTYLSKGILQKAKDLAQHNVTIFSRLVNEACPLIGIEPSAILTFRDEYIDLLEGKEKEKAKKLAKHVYTIEEFLSNEKNQGYVHADSFHHKEKHIALHGHCYQKSLSSQDITKKILSLPKNYTVEVIPSGCCGMAGSFGYEKNHYEVSMKIGEMVLFPTVRKTSRDTLIAAPGTSCRHQIFDGTQRNSFHPVEILHDALK